MLRLGLLLYLGGCSALLFLYLRKNIDVYNNFNYLKSYHLLCGLSSPGRGGKARLEVLSDRVKFSALLCVRL